MKLKKKINLLAVIIPVITLSFFLIPSAEAQQRKKKGGRGGSGISIQIGGGSGYGGYSNYRGYNQYRSYNTSRYYSQPKTYRVSVLYHNTWQTKYCGTCAKTAYSTASYYRSCGLPVRY